MQDAIKALSKAQTEMGKAIKNAKNPHLKSNYADLGSVMDACFEALHANGFAVMQPCGGDDRGQYVETHLAHASGHIFTSRVYLVVGKQDMQGVGSAITYARRYGLLGMAGLAPEDDDGEATKAQPRNDQQKSTAPRQTREPTKDADELISSDMIDSIRKHGVDAVTNDPAFQKDFAALRQRSPQFAARVDAEIETKQQGKAA